MDSNSPYPLLAEAHEQLGDRQPAVAALTTYWRTGGRSPAALIGGSIRGLHGTDWTRWCRRIGQRTPAV